MLFHPPRWCRNRHLQTLWGPAFRRGRVPLRRERFETRDGDFVDLDWLDGRPGTPIALVLHGLEGCAHSHYIRGLVRGAGAQGWRAAVLYFRSCSGEPNRLPRFYHGGDTGDLDEVVRALAAREPGAMIGAVGVSIGGNVLLKWLGEHGDDAPLEMAAAVAISAPFDLASCAGVLDRGLAKRVYTARFLRSFRAKIRAKLPRHPAFVDVDAAMRARTFAEYDRAVTAPLGGFTDERDYWARSSARGYLAGIRRPTLLVNALDDPFVPRDVIPEPGSLPPWIKCEYTSHGGHAGFVDRPWSRAADSWAERRAIAFLADVFGVPGSDVDDAAPTARAGQWTRRRAIPRAAPPRPCIAHPVRGVR